MTPPRRSLLSELKRRHVYRVGAMYLAASFVVWQVADIVVPALDLPATVMRVVVIAALAGFPIALVLAWIYELTPAGIRSTKALDAERADAAGVAATDEADAGSAQSESRVGTPARRLVAGLALVVVLLSGMWWAVGGRLLPRAVDPAEMTLAVFPFTVRGGGSVEYLREGVVDLLSRNLTGVGELSPLDPTVVLRAVGSADRLEVEEAANIARRIGAGQFVIGSVSQAGAQIRIDATLYALRDSITSLPTNTVQGDTAQLFLLIDQLTAALLAERSTGAASQRLTRTAATTTASLPALKAYLEGEQRFRAGEHGDGIDAFRRAIALDSTFALARYRLAMSHHMNGEHDIAHRESRRALDNASRLSAHDHRVIEAFHSFHDGRISQAEDQLRSILTEYPRDLEARLILAELLTQYAPLRGHTLAEARRHLEAINEADPRFACIYCQLSYVSMAEGDHAGAERWLRFASGRRTGDTTSLATTDRMVIGLMTGDSAKIRASITALDTVAGEQLALIVRSHAEMAIMSGHFNVADELIGLAQRRDVDRSFSDFNRMSAAFASGRWQEGLRMARQLTQTEGPHVETVAWQLIIQAPVEVELHGLDDLHSHLARQLERNRAAVTTPASHGHGDAEASFEPLLRHASIHQLLALLASRRLDAATAAAHADSIAALARASGRHRNGVEAMARIVRADVALRQDDPRRALRELEAVGFEIPPGTAARLAYATILRPRVHAALDQHELALRWLRHATFYGVPGVPASVRYGTWHRDMAHALDNLGRAADARLHYARFIDAWQHADAGLLPQVDAARSRLAALTQQR